MFGFMYLFIYIHIYIYIYIYIERERERGVYRDICIEREIEIDLGLILLGSLFPATIAPVPEWCVLLFYSELAAKAYMYVYILIDSKRYLGFAVR